MSCGSPRLHPERDLAQLLLRNEAESFGNDCREGEYVEPGCMIGCDDLRTRHLEMLETVYFHFRSRSPQDPARPDARHLVVQRRAPDTQQRTDNDGKTEGHGCDQRLQYDPRGT